MCLKSHLSVLNVWTFLFSLDLLTASLASLIYKFCPALPRPLKSVIKVCPSLRDTHQPDRNRLLPGGAVVGALLFSLPVYLAKPTRTFTPWLPTSFLLLFLLILSAYPAPLLFFQTFYTQFLYAPVLISTYPLLGPLFSWFWFSKKSMRVFFFFLIFLGKIFKKFLNWCLLVSFS